MRHVEERGAQEFYIGPGSGPVLLRELDSGAAKRYQHVHVPPALLQKHVIGMHLSNLMERSDRGLMYVNREYKELGTNFAVHQRDMPEQALNSDEPFME